MPKVKPLEFANTIVPVDADWEPADTPNGVSGWVEIETEAVTVEAFMPNVTPLELANTTVPDEADWVPAETATPPPPPPPPTTDTLRIDSWTTSSAITSKIVCALIAVPVTKEMLRTAF